MRYFSFKHVIPVHIPSFEKQLEAFVKDCTNAIARILIELHRKEVAAEKTYFVRSRCTPLSNVVKSVTWL